MMASTSRDMVLTFVNSLVPTVRYWLPFKLTELLNLERINWLNFNLNENALVLLTNLNKF
jgi:hypothetical protein